MGDRIRAFDWSSTSLGPIAGWPSSLRTAVNILLQSPVPIVLLWGTDGIMIYNDAYSVIAGARHMSLLGAKLLEGWAEVADFNKNMMGKVLHQGETLSYKDQQFILYRNNIAEEVWMDLNYSPVNDDNGNRAGVLSIVVETTQHVKVERRLQESEERFRSMAEASKTLIATCNETSAANYFNPAWFEITGRTRDELAGKGWTTLLHPDEKEAFLDVYSAAFQARKVMVREFRLLTADGSYRWQLAVASPRFHPDGSLAGYISMCTDINAQKLAEKAAEEASRRKSQFLANMSHELRTPLNAVIGFAEMMESGIAGTLNERQDRYVQNILSSGRHLLEMVNEILDLARIESGKAELHAKPIQLAELMAEMEAMFIPLAAKRNIRMTVEREPSLKIIVGDPLRLRQILVNLVSNAIKFNRPEGSIRIRWFRDGPDWVVCEVQDTGCGIPAAKLPDLFSEFYQVDSSFARRHEGTGLGLTVTRRLVELHGGSIGVESVEGEGSVFRFRLPAVYHPGTA